MAHKHPYGIPRRPNYGSKVGTTTSDPCRITGGAVQGSVLGILDHNAVLESLDDNLLQIHTAKYVDDITVNRDCG